MVELKLKKKMKDEYLKLTLFKVWVPFCESDERSGVISEAFMEKKKMRNEEES
jgi:hypothetical protein